MSVNHRHVLKLSKVIDALYVEAMNSPVMKKQAREDLRAGFLVTASMDHDDAYDADDFDDESEFEPKHSFDDEPGVTEDDLEDLYEEEGLLGEDYSDEDDEEDWMESRCRMYAKHSNPDRRMEAAEMTNSKDLLEMLSQDENGVVRGIAKRRLKSEF